MNEPEVTDHHAETLRCAECAATTAHGDRWRAYLTVGDEDAEDIAEVAVYCPDCAAREFGRVMRQTPPA